MAIDPKMNIAQAAQLYNQAQKTGIAPNAIPQQEQSNGGTGAFAGMSGQARLFGAATDNGDGSAILDCLFVIDLF